MKCKKCDNKFFEILICKCDGCKFNGAYDEENGYIYDNKTIKDKGLERDQVFEEGECSFGHCYENGCYIFECSKCKTKTNMPLLEE